MSANNEMNMNGEKYANDVPAGKSGIPGDHAHGQQFGTDPEDGAIVAGEQNILHRDLKGRHMQMIAMGGAIGAGLFVGSGGAFQTGGPASVLLGFMIIGGMVYLMMQALAEMSVMYPVNGAFTMYICRFVDPSLGFACGWEYAITFLNGFHGFCGVFVTAAFAYTGTELTGLAAAETTNPRKEIPKASKQVVWRIAIFYIVNLFLVGLIVPANSPLYKGEGSESRHSPFVIAIQLAGIKVLPSIFNAVILIAVMSVANSCTFGSTRTIQALAANGMAPKFLAYIDKKGRPLSVVILQLLFGCLAFVNLSPNGGTIFNWLLSLSGLSILFVYGSIGLAHIRFRAAWAYNGHSLDELPFRAAFGVWGSWLCFLIAVIALMAQFYVALYPVGGPNLNANTFFQLYLAGPLLIFLFLAWKIYSWRVRPGDRPLFIRLKDIDIYTDMREEQRHVSAAGLSSEQRRASIIEMHGEKKKRGPKDYIMDGIRNII
ncbi:hypothetical protein H2202_006443 [Exophiala xenobiotica]|nr:hypothetical protein H2202_006443 [Exophiala xenobiotica]